MKQTYIGTIAKQAGIPIKTIRYYEDIGLLKKPVRTPSGYRLYDPESVDRLVFIKKAQAFGFTLAEIKQIMQESNQGLDRCCNYVGKILGKKLNELETQIKELSAMKKGLKNMMQSWIPLKEERDMGQRNVEVFTSGCYLCEETVDLVKELACPSCELTVYDLANPCASKECIDKAKTYGINSVPTVVVDGKVLDCCKRGKPDRETLLAAGIGAAA
jgi:DNA-binding transcriptional MerR regulator